MKEKAVRVNYFRFRVIFASLTRRVQKSVTLYKAEYYDQCALFWREIE